MVCRCADADGEGGGCGQPGAVPAAESDRFDAAAAARRDPKSQTRAQVREPQEHHPRLPRAELVVRRLQQHGGKVLVYKKSVMEVALEWVRAAVRRADECVKAL